MADTSQPLEIGSVGRPFGIRGELRIRLHNAESELIEQRRTIVVEAPDGRRETWHVSSIRRDARDRSICIVTAREVPDRTAAETRVGWKVVVDASTLPEPEDGEFYYHEVPGWAVETASGRRVGTVAYAMATNIDVLAVITPGGAELLIPVVGDFVTEIDRARRRIVVPEDIEARFEDV